MAWETWTEQDWQALDSLAGRLKVQPKELAALMNLESSGRSTVWGGDQGKYYGLIQFGPGARSETGLDPSKATTPAAQMPYIEKYFQQRGFQPGKHNISNLYATVLGGNPNAFGSRDSNGTEAGSASKDMMPGGRHYNAVSKFYDARKGSGSGGYTNTSGTTNLASNESLDVTVKPFDTNSKLGQEISKLDLKTPVSKGIPQAFDNRGSLDLSSVASLNSDNTLNIDFSKMQQGKNISQAYQALRENSPIKDAITNLNSVTGALQTTTAKADQYNQKVTQLQQGLSGSNNAPATPANYNSSIFTTGNTGRSTGPHLDARVQVTDPKTGQKYWTDPVPYLSKLTASGKSVMEAFPVTSPFKEARARGPHDGIDLGTPVGTQIAVPYKHIGSWWDEGGGGQVSEYEIEPGKVLKLLHGSKIG